MSQGDRITDAVQISALLKRIMESRALLTVSVPDHEGSYNSAILGIDPDRQHLLLDELNPKHGHDKLLQVNRLLARANLQGVEVRFFAELRNVTQRSGIAIYQTGLPSEVWYRQQRSHYRVKIAMASGISVVLEGVDGKTCRGRILDMSETGLGVRVDVAARLERGDLLPCQLTLPAGDPIDCKLEVRHVRRLSEREQLHLGCRLVDLERSERQRLGRAITGIQRELIRKAPKDGL